MQLHGKPPSSSFFMLSLSILDMWLHVCLLALFISVYYDLLFKCYCHLNIIMHSLLFIIERLESLFISEALLLFIISIMAWSALAYDSAWICPSGDSIDSLHVCPSTLGIEYRSVGESHNCGRSRPTAKIQHHEKHEHGCWPTANTQSQWAMSNETGR